MKDAPSFGARGATIIASEANKDSAINPANSAEQKMAEARAARTRIPMSAPRAKLATPELPGFHSHWINDSPGRVMQAMQAGYQFVSQEEALITTPDLAGDVLGKGTDLGSRVSVVVGTTEGGAPLRAYLMKIPNELYKEDQAALQGRVDDIHSAIHKGRQYVEGDMSNRYVKSSEMKSTYSRRG